MTNAVLFAAVLIAAQTSVMNVQDEPRQTSTPRPMPLSELRFLPPQEIAPGRQVFSKEGFVGIVKRVDRSSSGEQIVRITMRDGTERAVVSPKFIVSDGGVVIDFSDADISALGVVDDRRMIAP